MSLAVALAVGVPRAAMAEGERVMLGAEAALVVPTEPLASAALAPGGTASLAAHFSPTNWLMPLVRARAAALGARDPQGAPTGLGSLSLGLRLRPRGLAHPEEPSRAACVWAEIDAGLALWGARLEPTFEAAVGFLFLAGDVDLGPVVRFVHVMPASPGDPSDAFLVTVGLEVLALDAR